MNRMESFNLLVNNQQYALRYAVAAWVRMKEGWLIVMLLWASSLAFSQEPMVKYYGVDEGLPSNEVYQVKIDSRGVLWAATDRGVCRFSGSEFEIFDQRHGFKNPVVVTMSEDNQGRMWFATVEGRFYYFDKGQIELYANGYILPELFNTRVVVDFIVQNDTLWIGSVEGVVRITPDEQTELVTPLHSFNSLWMYQHPNGKFLTQRGRRNDSINYNQFHYYGQSKTANYSFPWIDIEGSSSYRYSMHMMRSGDIICSYEGRLFWFKSNGETVILPETFNSAACASYEDSEGNIWLGSIRSGVRKFDPNNGFSEVGHYLQKQSVTSVVADQEGGMWFSTLESGLAYCPSPNILNIPAENFSNSNKLVDMELCRNRLFVASYNGRLASIDIEDSNKPIIRTEFIKGKKGEFFNLTCHNQYIYGMTIYGLVVSKKEGINNFEIRSTKIASGKKYLIGVGKGVQMIDESGHCVSILDHAKFRVRALIEDASGKVWIGTETGIRKWDPYQDSTIVVIDSTHEVRITDFHQNGGLFATTLGKGVLFKPLDSDQFSELKLNEELPSKLTTSIFKDRRGDLWVGTTKGLCQFKIKNSGEDYYFFKYYDRHDGIVSGEIKAIRELDDHLFVLAQKGVSMIPLAQMHRNISPPGIQLTSTMAMGSLKNDTLISGELTYDQNDLRFEFEGRAYRNALEMEYHYRLLGLDTNYLKTHDRFVHFAGLPPGEYRFEVKSVNSDGVLSTRAASWDFTIAAPYWQTWWFRILLLLVVLGMVLLASYRRVQTQLEKNNLQLAVLENEQKALTAQINPHFVYNAMNSIQFYILENNREIAADLLSRFSELMRKVLSNTKNSFVSLESELSILSIYLELEKERFEHKLEYELQWENELQIDKILVPSMVIQPHVENAIWHGLLHKKEGTGKVSVLLSMKDDVLEWIIEDNGVGIEYTQSLKIKMEKGGSMHSSSGIALTRNRLNLLSKTSRKPYSIEVISLKDENNQAAGTRVVIKMSTSER